MLKEQLTDFGKMFIPELIRYLYTMLLFHMSYILTFSLCGVYFTSCTMQNRLFVKN